MRAMVVMFLEDNVEWLRGLKMLKRVRSLLHYCPRHHCPQCCPQSTLSSSNTTVLTLALVLSLAYPYPRPCPKRMVCMYMCMCVFTCVLCLCVCVMCVSAVFPVLFSAQSVCMCVQTSAYLCVQASVYPCVCNRV